MAYLNGWHVRTHQSHVVSCTELTRVMKLHAFCPPCYQQLADVRRTWIWGKDGGLVVSTFSALVKNDVKEHSRQLASSPLETKPTTPYTQSTETPDRWLPQADCLTKTLSHDIDTHALGKNDDNEHSRQLALSPQETQSTTPYTQSTETPDRWLPQADCLTKTLSHDIDTHALGKNDDNEHSRQIASSPLETKPSTP
jgi:hypothetical protein